MERGREMSHGYYGDQDRWTKLTRPLREADPVLDEFARRRGMRIERDLHSWPRRDLEWGSDVRRSIYIVLCDDPQTLDIERSDGEYTVGILMSEDRDRRRYLRSERLRERVPWAAIRERLDSLLDEAYARVQSWPSDSLQYATDLSPEWKPGDSAALGSGARAARWRALLDALIQWCRRSK